MTRTSVSERLCHSICEETDGTDGQGKGGDDRLKISQGKKRGASENETIFFCCGTMTKNELQKLVCIGLKLIFEIFKRESEKHQKSND